MTPHYVAVREDWTVAEVLDYIRAPWAGQRNTRTSSTSSTTTAPLIDDVRIRQSCSPPRRRAWSRDLMDCALCRARRPTAIRSRGRRVPQVRSRRPAGHRPDGHMLGIITADDVLDVAEAEATEDIQKIGGIEALDAPYLEVGFWRDVWKRGGWLSALFLGEMLTATAMGYFEEEIAQAVVLALFVPLIISSGGNSGSQAATLIVRVAGAGRGAAAATGGA